MRIYLLKSLFTFLFYLPFRLLPVTVKLIKSLSFRQILSALLVVLILFYAVFEYVNSLAFQKFEQFDFNLRKVGGLILFAERKRLQTGQNLSREEVIKHLERVDYNETNPYDAPEDGTYLKIGGNALQIIPRFPEDFPIYVEFSPTGIEKIYRWSAKKDVKLIYSARPDGWESVQEAFIQPEELQTSIVEFEQDADQPNALSEMNVRRSIASQSDVMESYFLDCVKAIEDERYEEHNGLDYWALLRIPYYKIVHPGRKTLGASTVEMQVMRNTVLNSKERGGIGGIVRKVQEIVLASNFRHHLSNQQAVDRPEVKAKILTLYANSCFLGRRRGNPIVYGYLTASEIYFGKKSLKELSLAEMMTLVSMNHGPGKYVSSKSTNVNYALLKERRDAHLDKLYKIMPEKFSLAEIERAKAEPIRFIDSQQNKRQRDLDVISHPFVKYALNHSSLKSIKKDSPEKYSHLNAYSTIDADSLRSAEAILKKELKEIYKKFPAQDKFCRMNQDNQSMEKENKLLGAIIAMDSVSGELLTFYGGEFGKDGYQSSTVALNALIQPASVYKSFVLADALRKGKLENGQPFTAASKIPPQNLVIRQLIKDSDNGAPEWLCSLDGLKGNCGLDLLSTITDNQITPIFPEKVPLGLSGGQELSPMKLMEGFNIFANKGRLVRTHPFTSLYTDGTLEIDTAKSVGGENLQLIDENTAYMTANILGDVIRNGTATVAFKSSGLAKFNPEIFGKSGSGQFFTLFVGSSPKITVSVNVNYECPTDVKDYKNSTGKFVKFTAAHSATLIWMEFMNEMQKYRPDLLSGEIPLPPGVLKIGVNRSKECRNPESKDMEVFVRGTEPPPCR